MCTRPAKGRLRRFDMTNEVERIEMYEIVLTRLWLPPHVRQVWEPRLGAVAS